MKFKSFYIQEGRNRWYKFEIKKTNKRWSVLNTESGQRFFLKLSDKENNISGIQRFLEDTKSTDENTPKTKGKINYEQFARDVIAGKKANFHCKSGMLEIWKKTWLVDYA